MTFPHRQVTNHALRGNYSKPVQYCSLICVQAFALILQLPFPGDTMCLIYVFIHPVMFSLTAILLSKRSFSVPLNPSNLHIRHCEPRGCDLLRKKHNKKGSIFRRQSTSITNVRLIYTEVYFIPGPLWLLSVAPHSLKTPDAIWDLRIWVNNSINIINSVCPSKQSVLEHDDQDSS